MKIQDILHVWGRWRRPWPWGRVRKTTSPTSLLQQEIRERRVHLRSTPATVNIEFTGQCHVKPACAFCVGRQTGNFVEPGHLSSKQLNRFWPWLLKSRRVNDCSFGEPMLYQPLEEVIRRLAVAGVKFGFTTNGLLLHPGRARFLVEHADWLDMAVSVNAANATTYYHLHGQDFQKLLQNLRAFVKIHHALRPNQPLPVVLSYIVMRSNEKELPDFLRLTKELGFRRVLLRHLFDWPGSDYTCTHFGYRFAYQQEILPLAAYQQLEARLRADPEFAALDLSCAWNPQGSFVAEQAEEGVDIPCLFPWKFLCLRPFYDLCTPCVFLKKGIAPLGRATLQELWNGAALVGMRRALAAGQIPEFCLTHTDCCPLVLAQRTAPQSHDLCQ